MAAFKRGLVSITFRNLPPGHIIRALEPLPVEGIEWGGDIHVPHGDTGLAEKIGRETRAAGMDPFCYGSYYRFREVGPDSGEQGPEIEAVLDTAEALGAKRVRLWAGEMDYQDADRAHIEAVANKARNIAEMASKRGLAIDLEFHRRTLNNSPGNSLELLKEINHTNVHTLWQPALGISSTERLEGLKLLLPQVSNIHCFHWGAEGIQDRRALAEGEAEWRAYLDVLKAPDKPRWISLEFVKDDSIESLVRDSQCLDTLLKQGSAG